jgi:hypothetical protein
MARLPKMAHLWCPSANPSGQGENPLKRYAILSLAAGIGLSACDREAPTAAQDKASAPIEQAEAAAVVVEMDADVLNDLKTRILPGLVDQDAALAIEGHLNALSAQLASGNTEAARSELAAAQLLISKSADSPDAVEMSVVQLALDQTANLLLDTTIR